MSLKNIMTNLMTPDEIDTFFEERGCTEEVMREIFADPYFAIFSFAFMRKSLEHGIKISIDVIRELKAINKRINWNDFFRYKYLYSYEEVEEIKKEWKLTMSFSGWVERD